MKRSRRKVLLTLGEFGHLESHLNISDSDKAVSATGHEFLSTLLITRRGTKSLTLFLCLFLALALSS